MKRSGSLVFLMELIIVILFFSLSTVVTLRLFINAYNKGQDSAYMTEAVSKSQSYAEKFRSQGTKMFSNEWKNTKNGGNQVYTFEDDDKYIYEITISNDKKSEAGILMQGELKAYHPVRKDTVLCTLKLAQYIPDFEEVLA